MVATLGPDAPFSILLKLMANEGPDTEVSSTFRMMMNVMAADTAMRTAYAIFIPLCSMNLPYSRVAGHSAMMCGWPRRATRTSFRGHFAMSSITPRCRRQ
jgi:hypothetical protein